MIKTKKRKEMRIAVEIYDKCVEDEGAKYLTTVVFDGVYSIDVIMISDFEVQRMNLIDIDPYQEYLELVFKDGETRLLRNSFCRVYNA